MRTQQAIEMEEIKRNVMEKQADNLAEPMQTDNVMKKVCLEIESACRMENVEQYNRRDCLLFYGIYEHEIENTTTKVKETAAAMGIFIEPTDVSISHRLATRNRARSQPKQSLPNSFGEKSKTMFIKPELSYEILSTITTCLFENSSQRTDPRLFTCCVKMVIASQQQKEG